MTFSWNIRAESLNNVLAHFHAVTMNEVWRVWASKMVKTKTTCIQSNKSDLIFQVFVWLTDKDLSHYSFIIIPRWPDNLIESVSWTQEPDQSHVCMNHSDSGSTDSLKKTDSEEWIIPQIRCQNLNYVLFLLKELLYDFISLKNM